MAPKIQHTKHLYKDTIKLELERHNKNMKYNMLR